jgi:hypothetical protein
VRIIVTISSCIIIVVIIIVEQATTVQQQALANQTIAEPGVAGVVARRTAGPITLRRGRGRGRRW